jgi:hypothetical protein
MIGKPYAGELHVRFDEGEQDFVSRKILNGHEAGNGGYSQGSTYQTLSLFSTLPLASKSSAKTTFFLEEVFFAHKRCISDTCRLIDSFAVLSYQI